MNYIRLFAGCALLASLAFGQAPPAPLAVQGDVPTPLSLTADDLAKMPRATVSVPGPGGNQTVYEGVPLREILQKAGAPFGDKLRGKALTTYVLAMARDGYQVAFTLGELDPEFGNQNILVADRRDGKPLAKNQGPIRLVCPNDHEGARSVRMLETLHVVQLAK
jgi:DMSO/TMAO reductase YedYZ molybdopterin-dependent catalytic subunit